MVVTNVINQPTCVVVKLNTTIKFCKYIEVHEGHHFILMTMEVHDALRRNMDHFIREFSRLFDGVPFYSDDHGGA